MPTSRPKDWTLLAKMIERRLRGEAEDLLDRDFPEALRNWPDRIVPDCGLGITAVEGR